MKKFLISSLAALLVMLALPIAGVFAASITPQVQKHNCVAQLLPLRVGQTSSDVVNMNCFATFSQVITFVTNGAVRLPAATTPKDLTVAQLRSASFQPFDASTIGTLYDYSAYGGTSLTVEGTLGRSCSTTTNPVQTYVVNDLGTWDDAVTSLKTSTGSLSCTTTTLHSGTSLTGAQQCYGGDSTYVGDVMNNQAQSVKWTAGSC